MSLLTLFVLVMAGIVSGAINAVAGGGTFITFGVLTLFGMPPIMANASSSLIQFPGYMTSTYAYKAEITRIWRQALPLLAASAVGALIGSLALLAIDNPAFRTIVPWLLLAATAIFAAGPAIKRWQHSRQERGPGSKSTGLVLQFITSVYGGFFGAGMGIMMLATLSMTESDDFHRINALKNLISILIAVIAMAIFTSGGLVSWPEVLIMVPAVALGGYLGVWVARRVPQSVMQIFVVAVGFALSTYYFIA